MKYDCIADLAQVKESMDIYIKIMSGNSSDMYNRIKAIYAIR